MTALEALLDIFLELFGPFLRGPTRLRNQLACCLFFGIASVAGSLWLFPSLPEAAETWRTRWSLFFLILPIIGLVFAASLATRHRGLRGAALLAAVPNIAALAFAAFYIQRAAA